MEFTNEILFNKNLVSNESVIITYSGKLYKEHSKDVSIVYGYGDNWEYTQESQMKETENGFETTIDLKDFNTFNFCFKNSFNIWDNNFGFNYIATISPQEVSNTGTNTNDNISISDSSNVESSSSSPSTVENDNSEEDTSAEENESSEENTSTQTENFESQSQDELENVFSSLLNAILNDTTVQTNETVNLDNGYGLQSVDDIKEETFETSDNDFAEFY